MSQGSSTYNPGVNRIKGIPLMDCPACGREQLRLLQSCTIDNPGKFFVKCPRNEKGKKTPKDCSFFMWLEQYRQFVGELGLLDEGGHAAAMSMESVANRPTVEAMRVEVAGINGRLHKLGRTVEFMLLVNFVIVFLVVLILLVLLVK